MRSTDNPLFETFRGIFYLKYLIKFCKFRTEDKQIVFYPCLDLQNQIHQLLISIKITECAIYIIIFQMIQTDRNVSAENYWGQAAFSYKFFLISSGVIFLFSLVIPAIAVFCIDIPEYTLWSFQIWRLILSLYAQLPQIMSLLSLLFSFMWLHNILKDDEASTVYKIMEVFIINIQIHLMLNAISLIFTLLFQTEEAGIFFGYGWFPIIIVYQFRNSVKDPEGERRFCCFPFMIKNKYFPWVILFFITLFTTQLFCFVACGIVGYVQQVIRKQMIIKLPLCFYVKCEQCLPDSIKKRSDFVMINQVTAALAGKCWKSSSSDQPSSNNNPFSPNAENQAGQFYKQQSPNIVAASNGTTIGGAPETDYRNYWAQKQQKNEKKKENHEIQIQPSNEYNSSYVGLAGKNAQTKQQQEFEFQQSQNTKASKKVKQSENDLI